MEGVSSMTKVTRIFENNETKLYGIIPNNGSFVALIQIYRDFDCDAFLPYQLLEEFCSEGFSVSPQSISAISFEEHYDQYKIKINIVVNEDRIPRCVIRQQGQPSRELCLSRLQIE